MGHKHWFWGIFFIAAAFFVIAVQVGAFVTLGFWSVAATVLLAAVLVASLFDLNFFGIFVPAALLYTIYQQPMHWKPISVWLLLLAAVLASAGLSMIFHRHHKYWKKWKDHNYWEQKVSDKADRFTDKFTDSFSAHDGEQLDGNELYIKASFNQSCKYLHADSMKKAVLISSFGKLSVYFDQVKLDPSGAVISVSSSFGEMVLYLPREWNVIDHVHAGMGAVSSEFAGRTAEADAPKVTLNGDVSFGHLEIRFV